VDVHAAAGLADDDLRLQAWTKLGNNFGMSKYFLGK